jgi:uncharacterized membrane protein YhaH (DUF805 family)
VKKETKVKEKNSVAKKEAKVEAKADVVGKEVEATEKFTPDLFFKIFFEGWKNIFNLKGRSSKFEVWCFLLVNTVLSVIIQLRALYVMSAEFLMNANMRGLNLEEIESRIAWAEFSFWCSLILPMIPLGAMLVRRMHDLGKLAWQGYLEQVFMGVVVLSMLLVGIDELGGTHLEYIALALSVCFITILYSVFYYGIKFLVVTLFNKGDEGENEYGLPRYEGEMYEELSLKFCVLYVLFIMTIGMLYWGNWYF